MSRKTANLIAAITAGVIVLVGFALWSQLGPPFDPPTTTTTVVETGTGSGVGKTTIETSQAPAPKRKKGDGNRAQVAKETKKTVETPSGAPSGKETVTTEEGSRSFAERVLGESGLALLQLGIILLAGFLTAAFVQRVLLGDYALKIGPLDIGAAQESKEDALIKLGAELADSIKASKNTEAELAAVAAKQSKTAARTATILSALATLDERVSKLEN